MSDSEPGLRSDLLLAEFSEAWSHYRHIESTRQKYLNAFFALLAALSGLFATWASRINLESTVSIAGMAGLCWTLSVLATLLYANIRKMGRVLEGYENTMKAVRQLAYGEQYKSMYARLSVRATDDPIMRMSLFRLQVVAEVVFAASALVFASALVYLTVRSWSYAELAVWTVLVLGAASCSALILFTLLAPVMLRRRLQSQSRRRRRHSPPESGGATAGDSQPEPAD